MTSTFQYLHSLIRRWLPVLPLLLGISAYGQTSNALSLDSCYKLARQNYPMIKQLDLVEKTRQFSVENASKNWLPQLNFNGQATYQSAVTSIPFEIPHISIPTYSRDQYKIYGEIDQTIYDAGSIQNQKMAQNADAAIQKQSVEVSLYALKDRVNQVFFGVLLLDEQLKQNEILQHTIQNNTDKLQAQVTNGAALKSGLSELRAELLEQQQNQVSIEASKRAYLNMLGLLIGRNLDAGTQLVKPETTALTNTITRPELNLYDNQKISYNIQDRILNDNNLPKVSAFFQGGYGRPGLNLLSNDFSFYYIGGVRFSWSIGGLYALKNNHELMNISRQGIDLQKQTFLLNTKIQLQQENGEITKLQEMLKKDDDIINNRTEVTEDSKQRMENGMLTVHDYLSELDAENQARQNKILHQVQLLQAQYNYQTTSGK